MIASYLSHSICGENEPHISGPIVDTRQVIFYIQISVWVSYIVCGVPDHIEVRVTGWLSGDDEDYWLFSAVTSSRQSAGPPEHTQNFAPLLEMRPCALFIACCAPTTSLLLYHGVIGVVGFDHVRILLLASWRRDYMLTVTRVVSPSDCLSLWFSTFDRWCPSVETDTQPDQSFGLAE